MRAQVLLVTDRDDPVSVFPPGTDVGDLIVAARDQALAQILDRRSRGLPLVIVVDAAGRNPQPLLSQCALKYPEAPLVVATPPGENPSSILATAFARPAGSAALVDAIAAASRSAVQQARVRTTLDRINVRLRTHGGGGADGPQHRRLLLSDLYLSSILDQAKEAIFVSDRTGVVALWNRAAETLFGVRAPDIVGRRVDTIEQARHGPELLAAIAGLSADVPGAERELVFRGVDDSRVAQVSFSLIRDEEGTGVAVCAIAYDMTERQRLLENVEQQAAALAASNRHKEEFLAVLSHEMRTPLNAVLGWAHMLQTMPHDAARVSQAADSIVRNATLQHRLVTDLLDFARITAGKLRLEIEPGDLPATVREVVDAVRLDAQQHGLTLDEAYPPHLVLPFDRDRIRQVVTNLLNNAIKFTPAGGRVRVEVCQTARGGVIVVTDSGRGIPLEFLPHMFDAFRQAEESTSGSQGLGLGLAIVRRIVDYHGGSIKAESAGVDQGATFTVFLPAAGAVDRDPGVATPPLA